MSVALYREKHIPLASGFVVLLAALFGVAFIFSAFDRLSYGFSEVLGYLFAGVLAFFLAVRTAQYFFGARVRLTDEGIGARSFLFGFKEIPFDQIEAFSVYESTSRVTVTGPVATAMRLVGKSTTRFVKSEQLECSFSSGKSKTIMVPDYENSDFLDQLTRRSGKQIERLPPRKSG